MSRDRDNPEWSDEDFARARPFREVFPEEHATWKRRVQARVRDHLPSDHTLADELIRERREEATREDGGRPPAPR